MQKQARAGQKFFSFIPYTTDVFSGMTKNEHLIHEIVYWEKIFKMLMTRTTKV